MGPCIFVITWPSNTIYRRRRDHSRNYSPASVSKMSTSRAHRRRHQLAHVAARGQGLRPDARGCISTGSVQDHFRPGNAPAAVDLQEQLLPLTEISVDLRQRCPRRSTRSSRRRGRWRPAPRTGPDDGRVYLDASSRGETASLPFNRLFWRSGYVGAHAHRGYEASCRAAAPTPRTGSGHRLGRRLLAPPATSKPGPVAGRDLRDGVGVGSGTRPGSGWIASNGSTTNARPDTPEAALLLGATRRRRSTPRWRGRPHARLCSAIALDATNPLKVRLHQVQGDVRPPTKVYDNLSFDESQARRTLYIVEVRPYIPAARSRAMAAQFGVSAMP